MSSIQSTSLLLFALISAELNTEEFNRLSCRFTIITIVCWSSFVVDSIITISFWSSNLTIVVAFLWIKAKSKNCLIACKSPSFALCFSPKSRFTVVLWSEELVFTCSTSLSFSSSIGGESENGLSSDVGNCVRSIDENSSGLDFPATCL